MLAMMLYALLCVCILFLMRIRSKFYSHQLPPAYPGALPIIGHLHLLLTESSNFWPRLQDTAKFSFKHGGVIHAKLGSQIYYLITDPEDAITASNACTQKHFAFNFAKPWIGDGLITGSGEIWKRHRKLLYPAFSIPVVHGFLEVFNSQARKFILQLKPLAGKTPFDHHFYLRNIMLETFCLGTFGIKAVEDTNFIRKYMESVDTIMTLVTKRFLTFWLHSDILYKLSGLKKIEYETVQIINRMSNEILQRKKEAMKSVIVNENKMDLETKGIKFKPFSDLVLELSADGTLTDKEIREEVDTMIGAGFETTSNQLMYTLMLLGANPDAQNKMLTELLDLLGPDKDVEKDDLNKLVYTNAVIMESLRMFPSVPVLLRYVDKDVKLKSYTMRADSQCIIYPLVYPQHPMWGPDCDKFKPERWLDNAAISSSKEFAAFGLGKRSCIGRQYAMISMKVVLAHFIRKYKITADISKLKVKCDFVLKPIEKQTINIEMRI